MNPLTTLSHHGQSYWMDDLSRDMIEDGSLEARVRHAGLRGVTSNPSILHSAVTAGDHYRDQIREAAAAGLGPRRILDALMATDVQRACDVLRPVYDETGGGDGFVSLEVSPHLARDTRASIADAKRFWEAVDRPNLMIKIPGTEQGIPAIEELLFEGVNVNVTLLFSVARYEQVAEAYLRALERRIGERRPVDRLSSVASFFLSRIDVMIDERLRHRIGPRGHSSMTPHPENLLGRAAVACAKLAYFGYQQQIAGERWRALAERGARPQRLLWASTSTKDPADPDTKYVEPLIGPDTVVTMPRKTIDAFADHGEVSRTVDEGVPNAAHVVRGLRALGIDVDEVARQLEDEGIQKFVEPYDALVMRLHAAREELAAAGDVEPLRQVARQLRRDSIEMTTAAGSGHPTSSLSSAEIMAALFFREMRWDPGDPLARDVDRFILSKGHAAPVLWAVLAAAGALQEDVESLRRLSSSLEGHPTPANPWIPVATGSLGQGLAAANGMALANRLDGIDSRVFCLLGDAECSEGAVWEAAQFAALQKLDRVVAIVDVNGYGQSHASPFSRDTGLFAERFRAFGWRAIEVDGHDVTAVAAALARTRAGGPTAIVARTVKGRGVSFLEGQNAWHGKALDEDEAARALAELGEPDPLPEVEPRRLGVRTPPLRTRRVEVEPRYEEGEEVATRDAFGNALAEIGRQASDVVVLDGDVMGSTRTEAFAEAQPERFFEGYIAEQNLAGAALGLAACGRTPVFATFAAFLTRAYDFARMAAHSRPPRLVFCGSHAGVSIGEDGPSQMGLEDLAMFRALPGSTVLYPSDAVSAERLTAEAANTGGLVYLRTTRPKTPVLYPNEETFPVGGSKTLRQGGHDQLTIVAAGVTVHEALAAHAALEERGVAARVIDAYSVKPLDVAALERAARDTGHLVVVEDHWIDGGLGDAVAAAVGPLAEVQKLGIATVPHSGDGSELMGRYGISSAAIEEAATRLIAA